jgi:hypothetical protein
MKKLRLKALNLAAGEILNREQLKMVAGGGYSSEADCSAHYYYNANGVCVNYLPESES